MKVVVEIQVVDKVNEKISVLRKCAKVFPGNTTVDGIYDWVRSHESVVGDIRIVSVEE